MTRDTVCLDTPARCATSVMDAGRGSPFLRLEASPRTSCRTGSGGWYPRWSRSDRTRPDCAAVPRARGLRPDTWTVEVLALGELITPARRAGHGDTRGRPHVSGVRGGQGERQGLRVTRPPMTATPRAMGARVCSSNASCARAGAATRVDRPRARPNARHRFCGSCGFRLARPEACARVVALRTVRGTRTSLSRSLHPAAVLTPQLLDACGFVRVAATLRQLPVGRQHDRRRDVRGHLDGDRQALVRCAATHS